MIKQYNESDYNLQLRFLVSLRSSEGDRKYQKFLFLFLFFLPETEDTVTLYNDISLTIEIAIYFSSALAKEPQIK